ncbi:hypothetical protein ACFFOS_21635 [Nocardioides kongjuensis]|uniref:Aminoglycoside phosphotransferase domain-containing protein n=1 Tax=Nocardioides kongjuensis TaxID=349522 RepID=A0A852RNU7_9ACTN|nr:hypothetical protein [Nocardioides kongjuensis]NYD32238.1 hypothetical protein [Nocardioides kongjuensis]
MNQLSPHVLDDLSDLVGAALECPVRLMAQPGVPGETQFHVYDDQAHRVAVVRWADDPAGAQRILDGATALATLEAHHHGSRLVAPRLLALTTWAGRPLLVQEWGATPYPGRVPTRPARYDAERVVVELATIADLDHSYAGDLRARLQGLPASAFGDQLLAALDELGKRHDLDALPRGAWHGSWSRRTVAAGAHGSVLVREWDRYGLNRPIGFDTLHFRLDELRGELRWYGAGTALVEEAPRILARWHGRVVVEARCVARLLLLELAARELAEVGPGRAPVAWVADWIAPTLFSA